MAQSPTARVQRWGGLLTRLPVLTPAWPVLTPAWPVLLAEHAGRCLKPAQNCGPELRHECPILPLDPLAAFDGLKRDGIGIDELAIIPATGVGHDLGPRARIEPALRSAATIKHAKFGIVIRWNRRNSATRSWRSSHDKSRRD
jgi:hypothetical protein